MSKLDHVARLSRILQALTVTGMIMVPLAIIAGIWAAPLSTTLIEGGVTVSPHTTQTQIFLALAIGLINPLILMLTLNQMRKLFLAFSRGAILTDQSARLIQRIGQGFVALAAATFLLRPLQMLILTMDNPPGSRSLTIGLNSDMIFFGLSGGLIIVIGWAMREASIAAAENRSFI